MALRASGGIYSPRDLILAMLRHKGKVFLFIVMVLACTAAVIVWYPRTYSSEAQLFVRVGRESVTLDPTATIGQTVSISDSRETEINSVVQILQSRAIVEQVVDKVGPLEILGESALQKKQQVASAGGLPIANEVADDDRYRAIEHVSDSVSVYSPRNSSVISLRYLASTPELAQQVTQAMLETYMAEHVRINRTAGSREFFVEQADLMAKKWDEAATKLRDTKNTLGVADVKTQRTLLEAEHSRLAEQFAQESALLAAAESRIAELKTIGEQLPERVVATQEQGHSSEAFDKMREMLYQLELKEREFLGKYTEEHPQVIALRGQVEDARAILDSQEQRRTRSVTTINPAREKVQQDLRVEQASAKALSTKVDKLRDMLTEVQARVAKLNSSEVELAKLQQEVSLAEKNYLAHAERLEQARIDAALKAERISNVNVIQPASYEPKAASPRKGMVAAMGLAIAMLGSLVIVIVAEQSDRSLRTPGDAEEQLDLPVLVTLPHASSRLALGGH